MRYFEKISQLSWRANGDFRAKATFGVASAALCLLLPVAFLNFYEGSIATGVGSLGIVCMLALAAMLVANKRCPENLILLGLVPAGMIFMITVFNRDGIVATFWCYPSIVACYCMLSEKRAWLANVVILAVGIPMVWLTLDITYALRIFATLAAISVFSAILVHVIDEQRRQLQTQLTTDPLTGLLNRVTLSEELETVAFKHTNGGVQSTLLAIDIDFFKRINDDYGHATGDQVLSELGTLLRNTLRREDCIFRVGGEEFLVLLKGLSQQKANGVAERIRKEVATAQLHNQGQVTISVGVAAHIRSETTQAWRRRCDERLYAAKRHGRNRVVAHTSELIRTTAIGSDVIQLNIPVKSVDPQIV